jgi:MoaA/NifB/PqqE/SkfB family radical SAM enzyme
MRRPIFHLPLYVFKNWVRQARNETEWIQPQGIGEPLLYPDLIEALSFAKRKGKKTMFYTNASLLTHDMSESLLDVGLDSLTFSVDGFNEQSFNTRIGVNWKKVLENVRRFQKMKIQGGYATVTNVRGTITDRNKWNIFKYYYFWRKMVDVVSMMNYINFPDPEQLDKNRFAWGGGFECYHIFNPEPRPLTPAITILNNGNVVVCCQDWFSHYVMGNARFTKIYDIWNGEIFNKLRKFMKKGFCYPYLCEFCRLGKVRKRNRLSFFRIIARSSSKLIEVLK